MPRHGGLDPRFAPALTKEPDRARQVVAHVPRPLPAHFDDESVDLRSAWEVLVRHRAGIAVTVAICLVLGLGASLLMRPVYRATALLEMRPGARSSVGYEERLAVLPGSGREFVETQVRILQSESVIDGVIDRLGLQENAELRGEQRQRGIVEGLRDILQLVGEDSSPGPERARFEIRRRFRERFSAVPLRDSNLVEVRFESFDPELSARVADTAVEEYLQLDSSRWHHAASGAREFLEAEIAQAEERLERSERELNAFARSHDIVDVDERTDLLATRVSQLSDELTKSIKARIAAETLYRQAEKGPPDSLAPVLESELVQSLKEKEARLTSEYERLGRIYRPDYPRLQQLAAEIGELRANRSHEVKRILAGIRAEHENARHQETLLEAQLRTEKQALLDLKDRAVQYHILKREWAANRDLHTGLLEQVKQVAVAAGIGPRPATWIDRASLPVKPHRPRPLLYTGGGAAFGLALGVALAFVLAHFDDRVRSPEELEAATGLISLGLVPSLATGLEEDERVEWLSHCQRGSAIAQAMRALRSHLVARFDGAGPHIVQVTSACPGEGKTTTAVNLAVVMAQRGSRVLLVDADLRRPRVHGLFDAPPGPGLAELIAGEGTVKPRQTFVPNLAILPAGRTDRDPADLLGSLNLTVFFEDAASAFDCVVIDSPPVLGLADSSLLSRGADGVVLVVGSGSVRRGALREAVRQLHLVGSPLLGTVMNRAGTRDAPYGYYACYDDGVTPTESTQPTGRPQLRPSPRGA